jgi:hypothetical protein
MRLEMDEKISSVRTTCSTRKKHMFKKTQKIKQEKGGKNTFTHSNNFIKKEGKSFKR